MESISFQAPAGYGILQIAEKALHNLLILHEVELTVIDDCEVALQELLTNIVEHSYGDNQDKTIEIRLWVDRKHLIIEVKDNGAPANIAIESIAATDSGELQASGYNLAVVEAIMDEVQYQYRDDKNIWKLIKMI